MTSRRQRQKENRAARREAERKQESRREVVRRIGLAVGMGAAVVVAFVVISFLGRDTDSLPGTYQGYRDQPTACGAEAPPEETVMIFPDFEDQPDVTADSEVTATITTSCGDVVVELDPAMSPETVESFVFLARQGFYDGTVLHRVVPGYRIDGGDPDAIGSGGPGYQIADEFPEEGFTYEPGVVAMVNNGRNTTGSQFFFVIGEDASLLNPLFNVLGRVTEGMDVLEQIAQVPLATRPGAREQSLPLETVYIESVEIEVG